MEEKKPIVPKSKLLEAGVYFGHHKSVRHPRMQPFIHTLRRKTHIIDLIKTQYALEFAYTLIKKYVEKKATFIFVGTKKIARETIKYNALRTNSYYVVDRWVGGTFTNHRTIQRQVKTLENLEELESKDFQGYTKKEQVNLEKHLAKLRHNLAGIRAMKFKPNVMIIIDPQHDIIAVREAKKSGVKIIGLVDTDTDPQLVDVPIPANDDSVKSVTLMTTVLADAIVEARGGVVDFAYKEASAINLPVDTHQNPRRHRFNDRFSNSHHRQHNGERTHSANALRTSSNTESKVNKTASSFDKEGNEG